MMGLWNSRVDRHWMPCAAFGLGWSLCFGLVACAGPSSQLASGPQVAAGPMVGHVAPDRARIWVQGDGPGWLGIEYRKPGRQGWLRLLGPGGRPFRGYLPPEQAFCRVLQLSALEPQTDYEFRLLNASGPLTEEAVGGFRTPPPPGQEEALRVAFGSCAGDWGLDPSQAIFQTVAEQEPDVFLWLGDNHYYSLQEREWQQPNSMWASWKRQRSKENLQALLRWTAHYAIWDDHDYGPDNSDKLFRWKWHALAMFQAYWANPAYGSHGTPGVWFRFRRGRVEFFCLDTRFHRDPNWMEAHDEKRLLGPVQSAWLKQALASSSADFKIIVSGNQVLAQYHPFESWHQFPAERRELLSFLQDRKISGVLFLSGDRHASEVIRWPEPFPYPLYEITSSPLAAGLYPPVADSEAPERLPGTSVGKENFGLLDFQWQPEPLIRYRALNAAGEDQHPAVEIRLSELQFDEN